MSDTDLSQLQERLRLEGASATRHPFVVGRIRRVLWPFIRSYHFIVLGWMRESVSRMERMVDSLRESVMESGERLRSLRAELLAVSRQTQEGLGMIIEASQSAEDLTQRVDELGRRLERHIAASEHASGRPDAGAPMRPAFRLGEAACLDTPFGPVILRPGDPMGADFLRDEAAALEILSRMAGAGLVAVDVGAGLGLSSCALATRFRVVHAVEPDQDRHLLLCANAALRRPGAIVVHRLRLHGGEAGEQPDGPPGAAGGAGAASLDSLDLRDVGCIRVGCVGASGAVILGALDTIRRSRPVVAFRWDDGLAAPYRVSFARLEQAFQDAGYRLDVPNAEQEGRRRWVATPVSRTS